LATLSGVGPKVKRLESWCAAPALGGAGAGVAAVALGGATGDGFSAAAPHATSIPASAKTPRSLGMTGDGRWSGGG
jgi:hypothetical protein